MEDCISIKLVQMRALACGTQKLHNTATNECSFLNPDPAQKHRSLEPHRTRMPALRALTHTQTHTHARKMHSHLCKLTNTHKRTHTRAHARTNSHTHAHTFTFTRNHAHTSPCTHKRTQTCTHTHTHTRTHAFRVSRHEGSGSGNGGPAPKTLGCALGWDEFVFTYCKAQPGNRACTGFSSARLCGNE